MSAAGTRLQLPEVAVAHLRSCDPVLGRLVERVGPIDRRHEPDLWRAMVRAIVGQQLSVRAAATIAGRVAEVGAGGFPNPEELLALSPEALRGCGLSRAKVGYVQDLAARFAAGEIVPAEIASMDDESVIASLTRIRGVGRWTAEMVLIFSLGRPDVFAVDDLGLRNAIGRAYDLASPVEADRIRAIAEPWRPYRSYASLYLWRSLDS